MRSIQIWYTQWTNCELENKKSDACGVALFIFSTIIRVLLFCKTQARLPGISKVALV